MPYNDIALVRAALVGKSRTAQWLCAVFFSQAGRQAAPHGESLVLFIGVHYDNEILWPRNVCLLLTLGECARAQKGKITNKDFGSSQPHRHALLFAASSPTPQLRKHRHRSAAST
jgi:hypothetical protein